MSISLKEHKYTTPIIPYEEWLKRRPFEVRPSDMIYEEWINQPEQAAYKKNKEELHEKHLREMALSDTCCRCLSCHCRKHRKNDS